MNVNNDPLAAGFSERLYCYGSRGARTLGGFPGGDRLAIDSEQPSIVFTSQTGNDMLCTSRNKLCCSQPVVARATGCLRTGLAAPGAEGITHHLGHPLKALQFRHFVFKQVYVGISLGREKDMRKERKHMMWTNTAFFKEEVQFLHREL